MSTPAVVGTPGFRRPAVRGFRSAGAAVALLLGGLTAATPARADVLATTLDRNTVKVGEPVTLRVSTDVTFAGGKRWEGECVHVFALGTPTARSAAGRIRIRHSETVDSIAIEAQAADGSELAAEAEQIREGLLLKKRLLIVKDLRFFVPGRFVLTRDAEASTCRAVQEPAVPLEVLPDYAPLRLHVFGAPGVSLVRNIDGTYGPAAQDGVTVYPDMPSLAVLKAFGSAYAAPLWPAIEKALVNAVRGTGAREVKVAESLGSSSDLVAFASKPSRRELYFAIDQRMPEFEPLIREGKLAVIGAMDLTPYGAALERAAAQQREQAAADAERTARVEPRLSAEATGYVAVRVRPEPACAIASGTARDGLRDEFAAAYLASDGVTTWRGAADAKLGQSHPDLNALYRAVVDQKCGTAVLTGADASTLVGALRRERIAYALYEMRGAADLLPAVARLRGFDSADDLQFARQFEPALSPDEVRQLRAHRLASRASFDTAAERMKASGYAADASTSSVLSFLEDESAGSARRMTAVAIRSERQAQQRAEAQRRERAAAAEREAANRRHRERFGLYCRQYVDARNACAVAPNMQRCLDAKGVGLGPTVCMWDGSVAPL
jgi:hypothetical protein